AERFLNAWQLATRHIEEIAAAEQRKTDSAQAENELQAAIHILETTLADYQGQADFDAPALAAVMKTQEVRWEVAAALHTPAAALQQRHAQVSAGLARLAALLADWQQDQPAATAALEALAHDAPDDAEKATAYATLTRLRERYATYALPLPQLLTQAVAQDAGTALTPTAHDANSPSANNAKTVDTTELQRWMDELDGHLDAGRSREATRLWRRLQEKARVAHWHPARMTALGERMRELKSWAGFAVLPKKEALLANMQALADAHTLDPEDKADRIRNLQAEWKALGVVDSAVEQPLWEQFKAASDTAYEPCRLHFAAQRELRQKNLAQRVVLCEQLEAYRDALSSRPDADVDWKNHDAIMKTARSEWQLLIPVERRDATVVQERFNHVLKALEARLRDHQNTVAAAKQALVAKAQTLVNSNDLRAACDSTRQLQVEWKALGQAHPKADRQLWQDFRNACDAVFARREADFNARQQARTEVLQQAQALVAALEALAAEGQPARAGEAARLEESFSALALPREDAGPLRQRIQQAQKHYETTLREYNAAQQRQRLNTLLEAWRAVAACEQTPDTAPPALDDLPASVRQALQGRLARLPQAASAPLDATAPSDHEAQLHTALLDMEIGLDQPSPPGHENSRRERLMARLQEKGLRGKQTFDVAAALAALLAIGPLTVAMTEASVPRLEALLKAVPQRDGSRLY
ncbi:MAG: DUF349 domain-containing protein, partial [Moraxellaceae bacterium]|nr:DUF349 domain-containing protein [Moraxellaceae bacterium]